MVDDVARLLGSAVLPIVLLCVGANIRVRKMAMSIKPTIFSMLGKMLVFPLVRQMGGDAPLMAAIITIQSLFFFVTLPLTIIWATRYFH